jgi:putative flippase GtrA
MIRNEIGIIIPALNPNEKILKIVEDLKRLKFQNIIVVDDGSKKECKKYFQILKDKFNATIIENINNCGKGASIKAAIKQVYEKFYFSGIITMDCDGQHLVEDVVKIADEMNENDVIFGIRNFNNPGVPFRSKFGNKFSSFYLKLTTGIYLEDTQTGLRGIPKKYFELAINTEGQRYEYEMNFLLQACLKKVNIKKVYINTVYGENESYFRIIRDSYKIYNEFFKNIIASLICAIVDVLIFGILLNIFSIFLSNIIARISSGFFDFALNKIWVFKKKNSKNTIKEFIKYVILFLVQMLINSILVTYIVGVLGHCILVKIIINIVLYFINFFIKKRLIFKI